MTGQQLKNSILQEAIEGRLVPQNPDDEPASVLLERIRAEKARLVKEKKIKKDKNESRIYRTEDGHWMEHFEDKNREDICIDEEIPFDVPSGWEWCRLGNIIDFSKSNSVKPNTIQDNDWVLDLEDIEKDSGRLLRRKTKLELDVKSDKHLFHKGNVLYSKLRPYLNKVIIAKEDGYCTSEILAFDFKEIYNKYAQSFFMSKYFVDYAMKDAYGVKMPRLGSKQGNLTLFPLPPLAEQHRIVEKIESLLPKVEAYGKAQEELVKLTETLPEQLKKSILQEAIEGRLVPQDPNDEPASVLLERIRAEKARLVKEKKIKKDKNESRIYRTDDGHWMEHFEDKSREDICIDEEIPFELPSGWEWCRLGNIIKISSGDGLTSKDMDGGSIPVYGGNGITGYHSRFNIDKETVVIGRVGYYCGSVHVTPAKAWVTDNAFITEYPINFINRDFLVYSLKHMKLGRDNNATAQPVVSGKKIYPLLFPLPPLAEQHRIVEKIESLLPKIEKLKVNK